MKALVTGARGQLGTDLIATAPAGVRVVATDRTTFDITDRARVGSFLAETRPDVIINAAAYTAVDKAETESDLAFRINRDGAANLAESAHALGARLIQVSTDYVFDGAQSSPYKPGDRTNPINVYGASKLAGEQAVADRTGGSALIVRTAWLYSATGSNFVKSMAKLLRERDEVRVVCDQIGTPTHANGLAAALWQFTQRSDARGIYHWTDAGTASWYDFAIAIRGALLDKAPRGSRIGRVVPIPSADYKTLSKRPPYSVLDKTATWQLVGAAPHWQVPLVSMLAAESAAA